MTEMAMPASGVQSARTRPVARARILVRNGFATAASVAMALALLACVANAPEPAVMIAEADTAVAHNPEGSFSVGVVPNRAPPVQVGDTLGFTVSSSAPGYGHLYLLNASGAVMVLVENLPLAAGGQVAFPAPDAGFAIRANPPAGIERVILLATKQPFVGFAGGADGPVQLPLEAAEFLEQVNSATSKLPKTGWASAEAQIETIS